MHLAAGATDRAPRTRIVMRDMGAASLPHLHRAFADMVGVPAPKNARAHTHPMAVSGQTACHAINVLRSAFQVWESRS